MMAGWLTDVTVVDLLVGCLDTAIKDFPSLTMEKRQKKDPRETEENKRFT